MLKLINVCKEVNGEAILKNISLTFKKTGFYVIEGPSGSGKTSLLNIIANFDPHYKGHIFINGIDISKSLHTLSFITQNHLVFKDETINNNLSVALELEGKKFVEPYYEQYIKTIFTEGINLKQYARELSGGQCQRLSSLMAIIKDSDIILCDEITSKLDKENAIKVMEILKEKATNTLVILVSHDHELIENYWDFHITISDGEITSFKSRKKEQNIKVRKRQYHRLRFKTIIKMVINKMRQKVKRVMLCATTFSIGLSSIGLSFFISSTLKKNFHDSFSSIINKDEIIMKEKTSIEQEYHLIEFEQYEEINQKYHEFFSGVGVKYITNIDTLLEENKCEISYGSRKLLMANLTLNDINNYKYYYEPLENDEIILECKENDIQNIKLLLNIANKSDDYLNNFLLTNHILMTFTVSNSNWQYKDSISFRLNKIILSDNVTLLHSNPIFNEIIFEDLMRFKNQEYVVNYIPWALYKDVFLRVKNREEFLKHCFNDDYFKRYLPIKYGNHLQFIKYKGNILNNNDIKKAMNKVKNLQDIKLSTGGSYLILEQSMISGFASDFLFSSDETLLSDAIEKNNVIEENKRPVYGKNIAYGNILNLTNENVNFSSRFENVSGTIPKNDDEIVISSSLANFLFNTSNCINKKLNVAYLKKITVDESKKHHEYAQSFLKITGVIENKKFLVYQNYDWLINFFLFKLDMGYESLIVDKIQFKTSEKDVDKLVSNLNESREYTYINSSANLGQTITSTINIAKNILLVFASFSIILSLIMVGLILILFEKENKSDFITIFFIGGKRKDVINYKTMYLVVLIFISMMLSIITLLTCLGLFKMSSNDFLSFEIKDCLVLFTLIIVISGILMALLTLIFQKITKNKQNIADLMRFYK